MNRNSLVSINEASQILGVSEATLRMWTDEGQVPVFITPGGHRRYPLVELKRFIASRQKVLSVNDLVQKLAATSPGYKEIARCRLKPGWYRHLSPENNEQLLHIGQSLFSLMLDFLKNPSQREQIVHSARIKGEEFGNLLARLGLSLTDSVEAFIYNRSYALDFITNLMTSNVVQNKKVFKVLPLITHMMDEVLVSLVSSHQAASKSEGLNKNGMSKN